MDDRLFQENERTQSDHEDLYADIGEIELVSGVTLPAVRVAYRSWGTLNSARDNAILVCHALSGNANAARWWERIVGPGKALDTDNYFVVCTNALGGCDGTTGPASIAPDGKRFGSRFPIVLVEDMVDVQAKFSTQVLGIDRWRLVAGGSMGGMQAVEWAVRHPSMVRSVWATASCAAHSAMQIGLNETARQAVVRDPKWMGGDYNASDPPSNGVAVARMVGHLSYLSEASFEHKFGRRLQSKEKFDYHLGMEFQVESYLAYQGDKFCNRFDASSLVYLTKALDYYECASLEASRCSFLFSCFTSDWLYPCWQSEALYKMALASGRPARLRVIESPWGHDCFLLDDKDQASAVAEFLAE